MRYWLSFYVDPYFFKLPGGYAKQVPVVYKLCLKGLLLIFSIYSSKFIDDGHGGVRQKLFQKEFGVLINNENPLFPTGLYKFAIYSYEVKHEAKFECGFISLNDGPLNCKLSINVKVFLRLNDVKKLSKKVQRWKEQIRQTPFLVLK